MFDASPYSADILECMAAYSPVLFGDVLNELKEAIVQALSQSDNIHRTISDIYWELAYENIPMVKIQSIYQVWPDSLIAAQQGNYYPLASVLALVVETGMKDRHAKTIEEIENEPWGDEDWDEGRDDLSAPPELI